jgi:hypothetical protein
MNSQTARPKKKPTPARAAIGRLALGHFIAYPIGFLAAIGAMPIGMVVRERALIEAQGGATTGVVKDVARDMNLNPTEAAQVQVLLEFSLVAALLVLLVIHLAAIPWAVGAARTAKNPEDPGPVKRGLRAFVIITLVTTALTALTTLAAWVWLLTL